MKENKRYEASLRELLNCGENTNLFLISVGFKIKKNKANKDDVLALNKLNIIDEENYL